MFYTEFQTPYTDYIFVYSTHNPLQHTHKFCKNNYITQTFSTLLYIYIHTKPSILSLCNAVGQRDFVRNHNGNQIIIKWSYRSMKTKAMYDIGSWKMCTYFIQQFEKSLWKWIKMKIIFKEFYTYQHLAILHKSETYSYYYLWFHSPRVFFNAMLLMFSEEKRLSKHTIHLPLVPSSSESSAAVWSVTEIGYSFGTETFHQN